MGKKINLSSRLNIDVKYMIYNAIMIYMQYIQKN